MKSLLKKAHLLTVVTVITLALLCTGSALALNSDPADSNALFDHSRVYSFYIIMDPVDWEKMRSDCPGGVCPWYTNPNIDPNYYYAVLSCGDWEPMLVGIHRKNDPAEPNDTNPQKFSMKIDINRYITDQKFAGKSKLDLECGSQSSPAAEAYTWNIYEHTGMVSAKAGLIKVYISTDGGSTYDYKGVFAHIEQIDKEFLKDHDVNDSGWLYKAEDWGDTQQTHEVPPEPNPFRFNWYPFDHPGYMTETVPPPSDWLTQSQWRVNMPQLMKLAVAENFCSEQDGFINKGNNYWYYDWSTNPLDINDPCFQQPRLYFSWDHDAAMKTANAGMSITLSYDAHLMDGLILELQENGTPYPYHTYKSNYLSTYKSMIDGPLAQNALLAEVNALETVYGNAIDTDPYAVGGNAAQQFGAVRSFITARTASVTSQLAALVPSPLPWSDGFESGSFSAGWTTQNSNATVTTGAKYTGTYGAQLKAATWIEKLITTAGFTGIHVKYRRQTTGFDSGENIYVEWSTNGTTWNNLETIQTATYAQGLQDKTCAAGADNNDNFRIRFSTNASANNETAFIDDVNVSGTPIPPPGQATSPTPADIATNVSLTQDLSWTAGPNALSHDVYFGTVNPPPSQGNQAGTTFDTGTMANGTTYYWRIDEKNAGGTTTGTVWSFTTVPPLPGQASNPTPADSAPDVSITNDLSWTAGSDANSHDVYFGTESPGTFQGNQAGTTFDTGTMANGTTYYWRIDERNAGGVTTGDLWTFTTIVKRTLTTSSTTGGDVTTPGEGPFQYDNGTVVNLVATADLSYHFVNWTGTAVDDGKVADPNSATTTVAMDGDYTVQANFAIDQRTLTISSTAGGDVTQPGEGVFQYGHGTVVNLNAVPNAGYHLVNWTGDTGTIDNVNSPVTTITMNGNYAIQANFGVTQYTISGAAGANGSIDPSGDITKDYGSSQLFTASANLGYEVDTWSLDGNSVQPGGLTYTLSDITASHTVGVTFKEIVLAISGHVLEADGNTPVEGVLIQTDNNDINSVTDANGYYELLVDYGWSGIVTPQKEGYIFEPNADTYSNVTQDYSDANYTATLMTFKIAGYVLEQDYVTPINDVNVSAENGGGTWTSKYGGGSALTDVNGFYEVQVDSNWSGSVTPTKHAYAFEPNGRYYEDVNDDWIADQDYTGTLLTFRITGCVRNECNVPIEGVLVDADNGGGQGTSDANGLYEVWVDYGWFGVVTPSKNDYTFDPNQTVYVDVFSDQADQNYVAYNIYDLDCDGAIDLNDLKVLCVNWLGIGEGDFDNDGMVAGDDFAKFAAAWLLY